MKKLLLALSASALLATASPSFAAWGLYDADRSWTGIASESQFGPITLWYSVWNAGTGDFNGSVLKPTAFTSAAEKLQIEGYDVKTYKNSGSAVTGGTYFWTVYETGNRGTPSFISINLSFLEDLGSGNQRWGFTGGTTSILSAPIVSFTSGLKNYTFEFYAQVNGTTPGGSAFDNNNSAPSNYTATFSTVPEPSTYALLALSAMGLGGYVIRRHRR